MTRLPELAFPMPDLVVGDTTFPARAVPSLLRRFAEYAPEGPPDECWPYEGTITKNGYGQINAVGIEVRAHRLAYVLAHGPIAGDLDVCHRCDNPPCCNPRCLFAGTKAENQHDKGAKGRAAKGERNGGGGKLTSDQVLVIRAALAAGEGPTSIGRRFGVSKTLIMYIRDGKLWSHVG